MATNAEIAAMRAQLPEFTDALVPDAVLGGWIDEGKTLYALSERGTYLCAAHLYTLDQAERGGGIAAPDGGGEGLIGAERIGEHAITYARSADARTDGRANWLQRTGYGRRLAQLSRAEIGARVRFV